MAQATFPSSPINHDGFSGWLAVLGPMLLDHPEDGGRCHPKGCGTAVCPQHVLVGVSELRQCLSNHQFAVGRLRLNDSRLTGTHRTADVRSVVCFPLFAPSPLETKPYC